MSYVCQGKGRPAVPILQLVIFNIGRWLGQVELMVGGSCRIGSVWHPLDDNLSIQNQFLGSIEQDVAITN